MYLSQSPEGLDVAPLPTMRDCALPTERSLGKLMSREKWGHASSLSPCPGLAEVVAGDLTGLSDTNWSCVMCSRMILLFQGVWTTLHCGTFNLTHPLILWSELSFSKLDARQRKNFWTWHITPVHHTPSLLCGTLFLEKALDRKLSKCFCISYMQCLETHRSCWTMAESCKVCNV